MPSELLNHLIMNLRRSPSILLKDMLFNFAASQSGCWDRFFNTLLAHKVKGCTFFIVGTCAEREKERIQNIVDHGFSIGSHGFKHLPYWRIPNAEQDLHKSKDVLEEFHIKISGFRPPNLLEPPHDITFQERNRCTIYGLAARLGFSYISSRFQANGLPYDKEGVKEIPINNMDWYNIYQEKVDSAEILFTRWAKNIKKGTVFLLHPNLTGQKKFIKALDSLLSLDFDFISIEQYLEGKTGIILTSDIAAFSRIDLLRRLL